ncbi:hypothetical protein [Mucilaginibacter lacusdianchii]|uniref:hypothetical protein n=1 Tax=Mucilaginibacter lacusdianchii TaxID=2684211 RepID=UPI00131CBBE4|nr:hypothetical protein [Mucilaginibacter sp. JXJ CY 39]
MKKAYLLIFLAFGTYKAKAQSPSFSGGTPSILPGMPFQPLLADTINFKSLQPKNKEGQLIGVIKTPNLQEEIDKARFERMLSDNKIEDNMPIASLNSRDRMPIYRAPDSIKYHMLISKPKQKAAA